MYLQSKGIIKDKYTDTIYEFIANLGVKQGDGASPELFLLFFDRVYAFVLEYYNKCNIESGKRHEYTIASLQLFLLAFADDLVLVAPSPMELQLLINCFVRFCNINDLDINIGKTKAMFVNCNQQMYVCNKEIGTVQKFKYLGL